jgi:hypothetical protein
MPTVAEVLNAAANFVEQRGLAHFTFRDPRTGAVCATAAIQLACWGRIGGVPDNDAAADLYFACLRRLKVQVCALDLINWNDHATQHEVVDALRAAAQHTTVDAA